jgi:WD40 repeat protein
MPAWSAATICWACILDSTIGDTINPLNPSPPPPATTFGDYILQQEIAHGGMGVVYRATQLSLNRTVAIKLLLLGRYSSPQTIARFRREAQSAAALRHPNIVAIHEVGEHDGQHYLSMDYVEGQSLAHKLRAGPLDQRRAADITCHIARAIHYAHEQAVLHRDIKPSNILLDTLGHVRITDFGLAKKLHPTSDPDPDPTLTLTGQIVGTPNYLSPEQAAANHSQVGPISDVYSIGALLYELLTGRPPFLANSLQETLLRIRDEPPLNPRTHNPALHPDLQTITLKCLRKEPAHRYPTAAALADDLHRWLHHLPITARPTPAPQRAWLWCRRKPRQASLLAATTLAILAALTTLTISNLRIRSAETHATYQRDRAQSLATQSQRDLIRMHTLTGNRLVDEGHHLIALLSFVQALRLDPHPDHSLPARNARFRIQATLEHSPRLVQTLFHGRWIMDLAFTPDATRLASCGSEKNAILWDLATGRPLAPPLTCRGTVQTISFDPQGTRLLTMDSSGTARIWHAPTGSPLTPPMRPADYNPKSIRSNFTKLKPAATFSPDGKSVLTAWGSKSAHLWDAATGKPLLAFPHTTIVHHAAFSHDGLNVVTSADDGTARIWDATTGKPLSHPLQHPTGIAWAQFSPDGQRILTVADRRDVRIWNWARHQPIGQPITHGSVLFHASFAPDGNSILTASWDTTARIWDAATGLALAQFNHPGGLASATFSPDGQTVATGCFDGIARIWDVASRTLACASLPQGTEIDTVRFSHDGHRLAVGSREGIIRVWELPRTNTLLRTFGEDAVVWAEFSPDGTRIVTAGDSPDERARVWDAHTGEALTPWLRHPSSVRHSTFSPDARRIATTSERTVRIWDASSGTQLATLTHEQPVAEGLFSPDGRHVLTACDDHFARLWDSATGKLEFTLKHRAAVSTLAFSPDGTYIATGSSDHDAALWNAASGKSLCTFRAIQSKVRTVQFNSAGTRLIITHNAAGSTAAAQVFAVPSGKPVGQPMRHRDHVRHAEFSRDGRWVATASQDRTARVWDASTGEGITPYLPHIDAVIAAVFTPDGERLATLSTAGDLRIWDAQTGEPITMKIPHHRRYQKGSLMFSPKGEAVLAATGGGPAFLHRFAPNLAPIATLVHQAHAHAASRIDPIAGVVPLDASTLSNAWHQLQADRR